MKNVLHLLIVCLSMTATIFAADKGFSFTSDPLLFRPLTANTFEPRVGLIWHSNNNRLRLDIGNSIDLIQYNYESAKQQLTIGSDFFTFTQLSGEKNFHFPVNAVDYLFGFNVNYVDSLENSVLSARLRLSHISAHFADGHYNGTAGMWKEGMNPRVYSREFFDLTVAYEPVSSLRAYLGLVYLWHVDPTSLSKFNAYLGGEYHHPLVTILHGYAAYQFTVTGLLPRHEFQAGVKLGTWHGRGTKLFFIYQAGNSIHGEYHDRRDTFSGVGFNIDF